MSSTVITKSGAERAFALDDFYDAVYVVCGTPRTSY